MGDAAATAAAAPHAAVVSPVDRVDAQVGSDLSGPGAGLRQRVDPGCNGVSADTHARDVGRIGRVEDGGLSCCGVGDGEQEECESVDLEWRHVQFFGWHGERGRWLDLVDCGFRGERRVLGSGGSRVFEKELMELIVVNKW